MRFDDAPVGQLNARLAQAANRLGQQGPHGAQVDIAKGLAQRVQLIQTQQRRYLPPLALPATGEHRFKLVVRHRVDKQVQQKAVTKRGQRFILGQAVGGRHADPQRALDLRVATAKAPLVEHAQQGIENGRRAEEHFVEKDDIGFWQHAADIGFDRAFAQLFQVDGAEQFRRFSKSPQQVFEITPAHRLRHAPYHRTFRRTGRADDQNVLLGDRCQHDQLGQLFATHQPFGGGPYDLTNVRGCGV
ncbi:hypothetical protein PS3A_15030 [Pseudomonas sp. 3A(2025)]